jgi:hypothetical protein
MLFPSPPNRPLRDHNQAAQAPINIPLADRFCHPLVIKRNFWNQNDIRTTSQPTMERNPARMTPHHLHDHHPLMTARGGVKPIKGIGNAGHRTVKSKGRRRRIKIVIDRLRHSNHGNSRLMQLLSGRQRSIASNTDQSLDSKSGKGPPSLLEDGRRHPLTVRSFSYFGNKVPLTRCPKDRSSMPHNPLRICQGQNQTIASIGK